MCVIWFLFVSRRSAADPNGTSDAANDCQSSLLICYKLIAREIVAEPPPEPDLYTFDVIKGVLRDAFGRPWFPLNPFYDPGPPPPRPIPKEMKDDEPATARRVGAKRKKD